MTAADTKLLHRAADLLDAGIGLKSDPSFRPRLASALRDVAAARHIDRAQLVDALDSDATLFDALGIAPEIRFGRDGFSERVSAGQPVRDLFG